MDYVDNFNIDLENFLKVHQDNVGQNDNSYNNFFNSLIYQSVCVTIDKYLTDEE